MNTEQEYRAALKAHDWYYDYSDDHSVWSAGRAQRDQLRQLRKSLDSDGKIWNEIAQADFKQNIKN